MEKYRRFIETAVKLGANDAKIIKTDSIITAAWICWKCRYGYDGYDSSLCCPPNSPTYRETRELVDCYKYALLVHFTEDADNVTEDPPIDLTKVITTLERDIFLAGYIRLLRWAPVPVGFVLNIQ